MSGYCVQIPHKSLNTTDDSEDNVAGGFQCLAKLGVMWEKVEKFNVLATTE